MMNPYSRTEFLLGKAAMDKLKKAKVAVFGLGGVGGYVVEALARSGVGALELVDHDTISKSNINRQILATVDTVGKDKVTVAAERVAAINPQIRVIPRKTFYLPETAGEFDFTEFDYVVDAIDTLDPKGALIRECWKRGTRIISSMGAGAKCNLADIRCGELWKTEHCTLAKNVRRQLRDARGRYKLPVIYSVAEPRRDAIRPNPAGGKPIIGSLGYFTATFGCYMAEYVIKEI